ncbi:hypothetical protein KSU03_02810 [Fusobacterium polymorphum]|uniref:hypothetical protein n=1 Tax=Fusobacterium nucleatum subsp. polymorphum TaxID=76857 RepID=UPI00164DA242|nr:hypothetical protein [Fusobacterium polymorphum]
MKSVKIFNRNILIDLILVIGLVVIFVIILRYIFPNISEVGKILGIEILKQIL